MKKDIDNRPPLGYVVSAVDEQTSIEEKYESLLREKSVDYFLDWLLRRRMGESKKKEKA